MIFLSMDTNPVTRVIPAALLGGMKTGLATRTARGFGDPGVLSTGIDGRYRGVLPLPMWE